jgi:2-furoyl-CoA dehydrogenase FAD binding subunit
MKPAPFDYVRAENIDEAVRLLDAHTGEARVLAGGQSLIAMLNMRVATPPILVDVSRIEKASRITVDASHISVGCSVRQAELERWPALAREVPLVAKALPWVGHVQTRSKGTVCGSVAHADPSSELPLCLAALNGDVVLQSRRGRRTVRGRDFFVGLLETLRLPNELVREVRFPRAAPGQGFAFNEMAIRHGDFAIVAIAVVAEADGLVVGVAGVGDKPAVVEWGPLAGREITEALDKLAWSLECRDDPHASAAYRRHLVRELGRRTIEEARACLS